MLIISKLSLHSCSIERSDSLRVRPGSSTKHLTGRIVTKELNTSELLRVPYEMAIGFICSTYVPQYSALEPSSERMEACVTEFATWDKTEKNGNRIEAIHIDKRIVKHRAGYKDLGGVASKAAEGLGIVSNRHVRTNCSGNSEICCMVCWASQYWRKEDTYTLLAASLPVACTSNRMSVSTLETLQTSLVVPGLFPVFSSVVSPYC